MPIACLKCAHWIGFGSVGLTCDGAAQLTWAIDDKLGGHPGSASPQPNGSLSGEAEVVHAAALARGVRAQLCLVPPSPV